LPPPLHVRPSAQAKLCAHASPSAAGAPKPHKLLRQVMPLEHGSPAEHEAKHTSPMFCAPLANWPQPDAHLEQSVG